MATLEGWIVFLLGGFVVDVAGLWVEMVGPFTAPERRPGCHYNNQLYPPGEIRVSECVLCVCSAKTGRMTCSVDTCKKDPECIRYEKLPGQCCPECVEKGCFYNQTGYSLGSKIPTSPCEMCYCPWEGGRGGEPVCGHVRCQRAPCVDSAVPPGKCCLTCPHGPNCWLDDLVIPSGRDVWVGPCRSCACPTNSTSDPAHTQAVCRWHQTCANGG